jgi:hypothetical protein
VGGDAVVVVNGQTLTGDQNQYTYESETGSYVFEFAEGFAGSLGRIEVSSTPVLPASPSGGKGSTTNAKSADPKQALVVGVVQPAVSGAQTASAGARSAARVKFSVFNQLRHLGTVSLGLDAASLGGASGSLQQLLTGGAKSGLGANADDAIRIAQEALAYVANVESILERAASQDGESASKAPAIDARDAVRQALAIRKTADEAALAPFQRSSLDSRLVFDLLSATSR